MIKIYEYGKISDEEIPTIVLEEKEIIKNNKTLLNKYTCR